MRSKTNLLLWLASKALRAIFVIRPEWCWQRSSSAQETILHRTRLTFERFFGNPPSSVLHTPRTLKTYVSRHPRTQGVLVALQNCTQTSEWHILLLLFSGNRRLFRFFSGNERLLWLLGSVFSSSLGFQETTCTHSYRYKRPNFSEFGVGHTDNVHYSIPKFRRNKNYDFQQALKPWWGLSEHFFATSSPPTAGIT